MLLKLLRHLQQEVKNALRTPSLKQKEAYGRLAHTLCAACVIGCVSVAYSDHDATVVLISRMIALAFWALVLFVIGALFSKGE